MRKLINQPYRYLMALALLLMPLGIFAQDNTIDPFLKFKDPTVQTHMVEVTTWTMNWSERTGTYPVLDNNCQVDVDYSSSDKSVATIDENGVITPVAPGTTTISASYDGLEGVFFPSYAEYTLTYTDDRYTVEVLGLHFSSSTADATYGDATVDTPSLEMGKMPQDASYTYSSSAPRVATVDASGRVTIVSVGSTDISASFAGNDNVKPGSVSYTLTVAQKEVGIEWGTTTFTYDGKAHAPTATATGLVGSDKCSVTVDGAQTNAGSYTATASALSNTNYKLPADKTITFTIAKAAATVAFASATVNAKIGESFTAPTATTTPSGLALSYASSTTSVATVDASTGAVTLKSAGSTTITASFAGNTNYNAAEGSYTLNVSKADAVSAELSFSSQTATATYGDASVTTPTLSNPHQVDLTWTSSDKKVAKVNNSGVVTIVGAGKTVISAAFAGNDTYSAATISYTLTVNKAAATVAFASATVNAKIGESFIAPTATTTPSGLTLTYGSSTTSVATVDAITGTVTLVAEGSTTITASFAGNDNYNAASASYTLTVSKAGNPNPELKDPQISFSSTTATATYGDESVTTPTLKNPLDLSPIVWSSSAQGVATVNSQGQVTIQNAGQTIISAIFAGNSEYAASTVFYILTIDKAVATVSFPMDHYVAQMGKDFDSPKASVSPNDPGLEIVYTSSDEEVTKVNTNTGVVSLKGAGKATITATFKGSTNYHHAEASYVLTVLGENEINPMDLDPVDPDAEYSFETTKLVNPDGTEMNLSNAVIENHFIVTMKNQDSPLGDGYDPDLESLVINTVTGIGNAIELLDKGIIPGSEEWAAAFTGLVFILPEDEDEGELIITSQEAKGVNLMVQIGDAKPVAINLPELEDYSIPCKNHIEEYVYLWNGGKDSDVSGTRGKKAAVDVRVRKVTYKSKGSSGIERVLFEAPEDDLWFSLSGQRISKPTKKGVYIHGHQKVVIK
ncbi:MAG: Ig-like domain-containing protein [Prevotella sp.]|nr:Ig-like domain-containing protein [Prevotella sp.]